MTVSDIVSYAAYNIVTCAIIVNVMQQTSLMW